MCTQKCKSVHAFVDLYTLVHTPCVQRNAHHHYIRAFCTRCTRSRECIYIYKQKNSKNKK